MAKPHWRQCVDYLEKLGIIPPNHQILNSENILDFHTFIKDGVILCLLANTLDKNSINLNEVVQKPKNSTFLCLKNVQLFLDACVNHFNLDPNVLFKPDNLFECTNFVKVLSTISDLSKSPKALQSGYKPLPDPSNNSGHNEDLYKNLEKLSFRDEIVEEEDPLSIYKTNVPNQKKEDTIYEDLCYVAVKLTSELPKCSLVPNNNRGHCIKELIDTERNYIDALNMISKHFMRPLKQLMKPEHHSTVFFEIKLLLDLHNGFYTDLYNCTVESANLNDACISKAFFNWSSFFIIYGDYVANLEKAQYLVTDLMKKYPAFCEAKQQCEKQANDGRFNLTDLIVLPMQRILKYHLLLKEIVKQTPETHPDYGSIVKSYKIMIDLGEYLNEAKRDSEMLDTINAIQNSITDLIMPENTVLYDYGRLLKDGEIKVRSHEDNKIKTRYVFLFDKVIVITAPPKNASEKAYAACREQNKVTKGNQYSFKEAFALGDYQVQDGCMINSKFSKDAKSHIFYLVDCSKNQTYTFYAKTEELKNRWIQAIEKALDNISPQYCRSKLTDHTFIMKSFEKGSFCNQCNLWFKGMYYQGYKCVLCSISVHKSCIPLVAPCGLPSLPPKTLSPQSSMNLRKQYSVDKSFKSKFENGRRSMKSKQIEEYDWYAHTMERQAAERILYQMANGAFLVRISSKQQGIYAISIKDGQTVKHMRILENDKHLFYLSQSKYFEDITDLVDYYSKNSLGDSFFGLTITLKFPYKKCLRMNITDENSKMFEKDSVWLHKPILCYARALYKFSGEYPALSFFKGDILEILDKKGEQKGWLKARKNDRVGFIPVVYVQLLQDVNVEELDQSQVLANLV